MVLALLHNFRSCVSFAQVEIEGHAGSASPPADSTLPAVRAQVNLHIVNPAVVVEVEQQVVEEAVEEKVVVVVAAGIHVKYTTLAAFARKLDPQGA